jgi:hypothetical protein
MAGIGDLLKGFEFNDPASEDQIAAFERTAGISLPRCYRDFLKMGNGGEGPVGECGYARFWKIGEIADLNRDYHVQESLPGYLLIGSDGGGEAFAIKRDEAVYVQVTFVGLSEEDCMSMGNGFEEFLSNLSREQ